MPGSGTGPGDGAEETTGLESSPGPAGTPETPGPQAESSPPEDHAQDDESVGDDGSMMSEDTVKKIPYEIVKTQKAQAEQQLQLGARNGGDKHRRLTNIDFPKYSGSIDKTAKGLREYQEWRKSLVMTKRLYDLSDEEMAFDLQECFRNSRSTTEADDSE